MIIGLATAMRPMPPVHRRAEVENSTQNWERVCGGGEQILQCLIFKSFETET